MTKKMNLKKLLMNSNNVSCGVFTMAKFTAFLFAKNDSGLEVYELCLPWLIGQCKLELCLFVDTSHKEPRYVFVVAKMAALIL